MLALYLAGAEFQQNSSELFDENDKKFTNKWLKNVN